MLSLCYCLFLAISNFSMFLFISIKRSTLADLSPKKRHSHTKILIITVITASILQNA